MKTTNASDGSNPERLAGTGVDLPVHVPSGNIEEAVGLLGRNCARIMVVPA